MVTLLRVVSIFVLLAGVGLLVYYFVRKFQGVSTRLTKPVLPVSLIVLGIVLISVLSAAIQISPTEVGVVENSLTGELYLLNPGTHIWPISKNVIPFITDVKVYSTRAQIIEIGSSPAKEGGVSASSNSDGQPLVFFAARGWATINKDTILELHRKYGPSYLEDWVEKLWVSSLKQVQGANKYDFVASKRQEMESTVEIELQKQLLADDGTSKLVIVSQLAIVDFDYDDKVNAYLDTVSQMQFQTQQAAMQIEINRQKQEAEKIAAETNYLVTKRNSEAEAIKSVTSAQGAADSKRLLADAEAYKILTEAQAEAKGITLVQQNLTALYNEYLRSIGWDGKFPQYWGGGSSMNLFNIPVAQE